MKTRALLLFALILATALASPACKKDAPLGVNVPLEQLLPKEAKLVMAVDLAKARQSSMAGLVWPEIQKDPDMSALVKAFQACYPKAAEIKVLLAADPDSEDFVLFMTAPGVGAEDVLQCIEKTAAKERGEPASNVLVLTRGPVRVAPQQDGGHAILLNKDTLGFAPQRWSEPMIKQIEALKPAEKGAAPAPVPGLGEGVDLWVKATLTDKDRAPGPDSMPGVDGLMSAAVKVDLKAGVAFKAELNFKAKESTDAFAGAIKELLEGAKAELGEMPGMADLLKAFKYAPDAKDAKVLRLEGAVTNEQIPGLMAMAMGGE